MPKVISNEILIDTMRAVEIANGSTLTASRNTGISRQTIESRIAMFHKRFPMGLKDDLIPRWTYPRMKTIAAPNTRWIIGSDFHIWGGNPPLIYKAFCRVAKELRVDGIVLNGDVVDGARISRHSVSLGSQAPKISKEIEVAKKWLAMLPNAKQRLWTLGNHDIRIDNYIAQNAPELDGGIYTLKDHFPTWEIAYAFTINDLEIRHRFRSGIHGGYNNALHGGVSMLTGHTHQLQITAIRDRRGPRWGVETGMMTEPEGAQFEYTEGQPSRWQQGFVVVSFDDDGVLLPPELCEMIKGRPVFRGRYII
jgi:Calcineurin-like phosphoesterase